AGRHHRLGLRRHGHRAGGDGRHLRRQRPGGRNPAGGVPPGRGDGLRRHGHPAPQRGGDHAARGDRADPSPGLQGHLRDHHPQDRGRVRGHRRVLRHRDRVVALRSRHGGPAMTTLPRNTTPTWEVELLISGVAVFAMLQLPGLLDDALFALQPRLDAGWDEPLRMVYVYLKAAAVLLALTFSVHLLLRAHWIAAVGMHSIYPDGVRWDRLRIGPVQRAVEEDRAGDQHALIERAD